MEKKAKKKKICSFIGVGSLLLGILLLVLGSVIEDMSILSVLGVVFSTGGLITWLSTTEKHGLIKMALGMVLLTVLYSWLIPTGSFNGSEIVIGDITRIGFNDFLTYTLLSLYYFAIIVTFLLIVGGFYEVLTKTSGYQTLISKLTKFLKGKEIAFVLIVSLLIAGIVSISNEIWQVVIFIPFIITLILRLKMDKMTAFATTFGSILIGIIGATFNGSIVEALYYYLNIITETGAVNYTSHIVLNIVLVALAYVLFNFFNVLHIIKTLKKNKKEKEVVAEDVFELPEKTTKGRVWPLVIVLAIVLIYTIVGYIGWVGAFNLNVFEQFHTLVTEKAVINDMPILSYILGTSSSFGNWDLYQIQGILLLATIAIGLIYKVKFNDLLKSFGEGAKKMLKPCLIILAIYTVCILTVMYPVMPTIADYIMILSDEFNVYLGSLAAFIGSIFNVEMRYMTSTIVPYMAGVFGIVDSGLMAVMFQSIYGFVQFLAPTSLFLMLGLSYLNISYKEWIKYAWKFIVILLVCIIGILTFLAYV